jgi:predicted nucleotidyltransferase
MFKINPAIPITQQMLDEIIVDVQSLYPEAVAISLVGTYARPEPPSPKRHDVDVLIRFPEMKETEYSIRMRDESQLWEKWRTKSPVTIDFLMRFGAVEPRYGHHQERLEAGLPTPEVIIWGSLAQETKP